MMFKLGPLQIQFGEGAFWVVALIVIASMVLGVANMSMHNDVRGGLTASGDYWLGTVDIGNRFSISPPGQKCVMRIRVSHENPDNVTQLTTGTVDCVRPLDGE